jgi:uncharacterized protein DUF4333
MITRGRMRRRAQRCGLLAAVAAALLGLPACGSAGSSGYDTAELAKDIRASLDQHPGFAVRSVRCPAHAKRAEGVVIRCSATLRDGEVDQMRATQTDDHGTIHLVGSLIFADNVERAVQSNLAGTAAGAHAVCPNHVPVVIGHTFDCRLTDAGSDTKALITIIDDDGGFRMSFS